MISSLFRPCPRQLFALLVPIIVFATQVWAAITDTTTWGGDNSRTCYESNHNIDPRAVASADFGQIFKTLLPGNFNGMAAEQIFSSPLVYTGSDGIQYVYVATTQNNIYKLNAKTGAIVVSRNLHVPFLQAELGSCVDINPLIGVTATGVIDSETGIWYLTAKTYTEQFQDGKFSPSNPPGRTNGRMYQHAIHTEDLSEVDGWPVSLEGRVFRNNPNRMFQSANEHSRPGALLAGDYVYTAYASHCVQYNYTGAIIGFNKKTGEVVEMFTMEGGPEPNTVPGGGIWMSGGGLAYDGNSMYFSSGNGFAAQLKRTGNSLPGHSPPSSLEEAAVNAKINADGTITIVDFFIPAEKNDLDGADKDFGTTPLQLLPSNVYTCPNHRRIGMVTGKSGKTYWLNLDNLGGYQMGPNAGDAVIQIFQNENSVYAGAGVLPLGGGYIYIPVTQYPTHVLKFSCDTTGNAKFVKMADTPDKNAFVIGTSHGTVTSINGSEGTGLLWLTDVQGQGLRVYDPIPPAGGGNLKLIRNLTVTGVTKFSKPVFGDGRVYVSTTKGYIYGFGSPVNQALNCSGLDFGAIPINVSTAPKTVICTALTGATVSSIDLGSSTDFTVTGLPSLPLKLSSGQSFSFNATSSPSVVGAVSTNIPIQLINTAPDFSSITIVTLKANGHSTAPILAITPDNLTFTVIAGTNQMQSTFLWNYGDNPLTIGNYSFSYNSTDGPWTQPSSLPDGSLQIRDFLFQDIPSKVNGTSSAALTFVYSPTTAGADTLYLRVFSDGGSKAATLVGFAGSAPKAIIEFQTPDGTSWIPYSNSTPFDFGTVYEAQTRNLLMRITNGGGPNAMPLSITVSKPPFGVPGIIGKDNQIDLAEGVSISANTSQTANLYCAVPKSQVNLPSYTNQTVWVLNTGDPDLGKQQIIFSCTAATEQVGPIYSNNDTAQYGYIGCFKENNPGRQLAQQNYTDTKNNTNGKCITACHALGYFFAGTQYSQECWCGNAIPIQKNADANCNYGCTGSSAQICGGNGILHDTPHISVFADSSRFDGNTTSPPLQITPNVGSYNFIGCYAEQGGKTVSQKSTTSNGMTVEFCAAFCMGYKYFGLEFLSECYCGAVLNSLSMLVNRSQCGMPCKGSNSEYCGGSSRMQVYQLNGTSSSASFSISSSATNTPSIPTTSPAIPSTTSNPATPTPTIKNYTYKGCYIDQGTRVFHDFSLTNQSMTNDLCAALCSSFPYFGTEYSTECYCAKTFPPTILPATDTRCTMPCASNPSQTCGGRYGLTIYQLTNPPNNNTITIDSSINGYAS
ncbi:Pyrrolo-quinoline quinone [Massarina eburnea CBS 473.64]|uniref:Pyrrolo-quinoline quinone n=1 Tax=Massarina eburnea CBS 473.64 TaxID=1395130 RepID=A0A6A6RX81_9PLEO|nr:Pyrrolo-quinoline quinone [Massarina eburnea CBS 473.64]